MISMDDSGIPVAYAMQASPKRYALFLGAGISFSAGLPSGKNLAADMVRAIAKSRGETIEGSGDADICFRWFEDFFEDEFEGPVTFDKLMKKLGAEEENRRDILQPFLLPKDETGAPIPLKPTTAHQMIAKLVKDNIVSIIITTNFDPLLEDAIKDIGIRPVVIRSDSKQPLMSVFPDICRIVKVNGDFENLNLKITPEDLKSYDPEIEDYLKRICAEYGLIVCGWSGDYDTGLQEILKKLTLRRYPTFWCLRPDSKIPDDLYKHLRPVPIDIDSADQFFTVLNTVVGRLQTVDQVQPLTVSVAVRKVMDVLQQPRPDIVLSQLIHTQTDIILEELSREGYAPSGTINAPEIFIDRINGLTKKTAPVAAMLATLAYYDDKYADLIYDSVERLINIKFAEPFAGEIAGISSEKSFRDHLYFLRMLPALIVIYATGIAATKSEHFNTLEAVFTPKMSKPSYAEERNTPYFDSVNISQIFGVGDLWLTINRANFNESGNQFTYTYQTCHCLVRHLIPSEFRYSEAFDIFEYLFGIAYMSTGARSPENIIDDLMHRRSSPMMSRVYLNTKADGSIGVYVIPDSTKSYLYDFGQNIEGTKFFDGDPMHFENFNRKFAEMFEIDTPDTGIVTEDDLIGEMF